MSDMTNETERLGLSNLIVRQLFLSDDAGALSFEIDGGDSVVWYGDGDCCSETWFSDIIGTHNLIGHEVLNVTEEQLGPMNDGRSRQEFDDLAVIRITTTEGVCHIFWRNSSNGYYGGSVASYADADPCDYANEIVGNWST
jgi:hypothetical protein